MTNLRGGSGVLACALILGCGDDGDPPDEVAPEIVSITPGDGADGVWLHDEFAVEFSEPIDPATIDTGSLRLIDADGADLTGEVTLDPDGTIARVRAADDATAVGALRLDVSDEVADLAGNRLAAAQSFSWTLPGWTIHAVDRGDDAQVPDVDVVGDLIIVASSIDRGTRIVATDGSGAPIGGDIASGTVVLPVVGADGDRPVVAWWNVDAMTIDVARWDGADWEPLPSPGGGSLPVLASSPGGRLGVAWINPDGDIDAAVFDGTDWQRAEGAPILATTVVGRPAIAMPTDTQVIAAFHDRVVVPGPSLTERIDLRVVPVGASSGAAGFAPPRAVARRTSAAGRRDQPDQRGGQRRPDRGRLGRVFRARILRQRRRAREWCVDDLSRARRRSAGPCHRPRHPVRRRRRADHHLARANRG